MEIVSLLVLGFVAVGVISYRAGRTRGSDERSLLDAKVTTMELLLNKMRQQNDQVHDALLRVNKRNTELSKKLLSSTRTSGHTYKEFRDDIWSMHNAGFSRRQIALKCNVPYSSVCFWLRKKAEESKNIAINSRQGHLI